MGRKYYDEFTKETIDKMAQSISDMTYCYEKTLVPKKHYKELLEKDIIEMASQEINIEYSLLKPYYDMINAMIKENRKYFIKALLIHELKLKYSSMDSLNLSALTSTWNYIEDNKIKTVISDTIVNAFNSFKSSTFKDNSKETN